MYKFGTVNQCIRDELKKSSPLPIEVERQLFIEYNSTDNENIRQKIFDRIILSNLKFVYAIANKFSKECNISVDDLYSEGKIGLIEAFHHYDHKSTTKFISFAVWYVQRSMYTFISESDMIRIPIAVKNKVTKKRKENKLEFLNEREEKANNIIANLKNSSIDMDTDDDKKKVEIVDQNSGYNDIDSENMKDILWNMLKNTLSDEELYIIKYSFGLKDDVVLSVKDIASNLHLRQSEFQKIKKGAYAKIQENDVLYGILKETVNS